MAKRRVAVFAFGTRGDVLPLAAVSAALAAAHPATRITFVTHAAHRNMEPHLARSGVARFVAVSTPPVVAAGQEIAQGVKASLEAQLREECIAAMDVAMVGSEDDACVLINLFALEGWHLAELFRVPCAVLSPYVVPYSAPSSFERRFRGTHPLLYRRLREAGEGEVGWDEVMHWMWPLFTDRWAEWRTRRLRLSACPLTDPVTGLPVLHDWPRASRLLYGFSPQVVECPAYWPKSVTVCGFWFAPLDWEARDLISEEISLNPLSTHSPSLPSLTAHLDVSTNFNPPVKLSQFLADKENSSEGGPIFIGLSSMGSMGFLERPGSMLKVLEAALDATNSTAILLTAGHAPLDLAVTQLCDYKRLCLDVSNNRKLRLNVGNEKPSLIVDNKKSSLVVDKEKPSQDVGNNEKLALDHVGNKKPCLNVGSNKLRLVVDNEKPCLEGVGNNKRCLDVDNEKACLGVGNEKPCRDGVGSRVHEGLTCFNGRLFCYSGAIPYLWLLPQCSVALHHGGSGTTAACLRAGVPQIICPFVLDQFYWAERMAWLGVAPQQPLKPEHLMPEERFAEAVEVVAGAVREAASAHVRGRAAWLREKIGGEEDGVAAAVAVLRSTFSGM